MNHPSIIQLFSFPESFIGPYFQASLYLLENHHLVAHFRGGGNGGNLNNRTVSSIPFESKRLERLTKAC